jgi:hypothetical protein
MGRLNCIWKVWKVNEVDWGPSHFWLKERMSQVQHVLEVQFGPQNCSNLQQSPRLHTESDLDVLALCGKLSSLFLNGSNLTLISSRNRPQLSFYSGDLFWPHVLLHLLLGNGIAPTFDGHHDQLAAIIVLLWEPFLASSAVTPIFGQWANTNLWRPP